MKKIITLIATTIRDYIVRPDPLPAYWASAADITEMGVSVSARDSIGGCVIGAIKTPAGIRPLIDHSGNHIFAIGAERSGKDASLVIPTLLQWDSSAIIWDTSGDCYANTVGWREGVANNRIIKFDPNIDDGSSAHFNPLNEIRIGTNETFNDAFEIAQSLVDIETTFNPRLNDAIELLSATLIHVIHAETTKTLHGVACFFRDIDPDKLLQVIMPTLIQYKNNSHYLINYLNRCEKNQLNSAVMTIKNRLAIFFNPVIQLATNRSDFVISDLMNADKPITLYLIAKVWNAKAISPLMRVVLVQAMNRLTESHKHKHKLLMMFNNFAEFGGVERLELIQEKLPSFHNYGIKCYFSTQSIQNIWTLYGETEQISSACKICIVLAQSSIESAEFCSIPIGTRAVQIAGKSVQVHITNPDELLRLKTVHGVNGIYHGGDILTLIAHKKPIKGTGLLFFTDPTFQARAAIPRHLTTNTITGPHKTHKRPIVPQSIWQGTTPRINRFRRIKQIFMFTVINKKIMQNQFNAAHTQPVERIPFELDPQIIHHIIYSQAGSLGKAIIELIMNSMDAGATTTILSITKEGFTCSDDGSGFATRHDVLRYFGRFGTPHQEGDATYGRFRLGRGQIMAHASTIWQSNSWQMTVDTRTMGYGFDLETLTSAAPGCAINGLWYEPLSHAELMSAVQEVRDLVRYTTVKVILNDHIITRDPRTEKWDFQDENAYYRVKPDGAVSISNQGILVRHDPAQIWGAGGLIVSKKAIGLNVSRTEILRKTCPIWKTIAKQFSSMADDMASRLGDHRKTEARREKSARALLAGDLNSIDIYHKEEVITLLLGKRHITMSDFLRKCGRNSDREGGRNCFAVVEDGFDVPRGEAIAAQGIAVILHPKTLERFACYNATDFIDSIARIFNNLCETSQKTGKYMGWFERKFVPKLIDFNVLRDAFLERTMIVSEKTSLDKETRRAWIALRCCLEHYANLCTGGRGSSRGPSVWGGQKFQIMLGESNTAQAWTDGKSYIAIDIKNVLRLKTEPMMAAATIFALLEHEISHQCDSIDCGHDEAFCERYHDISISMSAQRQRYLHIWLTKYTTSMELEGNRATGRAWSERYLVDRAGSGRQKRGLPAAIEDVSADPITTESVAAENMAFIDTLNVKLISSGLCL